MSSRKATPTGDSRSLAELAYDRLETLLVTLELRPGAILTEGELMERVGLGRTPVREGLQRLAGQGMLKVLSRRGIEILPVEVADQEALLETRRGLEQLVARQAAKRATAKQRGTLAGLAERMRGAGAARRLSRYILLDRACDEVLEDAARNPYAMLALGPMRAQCRRIWYAHRHNGDLPRFADLHAALMAAVAAADPGRAARSSDALMDELEAFLARAHEPG